MGGGKGRVSPRGVGGLNAEDAGGEVRRVQHRGHREHGGGLSESGFAGLEDWHAIRVGLNYLTRERTY